MSGAGSAAAAAINLALPALQAAATILILNKQKDLHDDVANKRIALIDQAVTNYLTNLDALLSSGVFTAAYGEVPTAALYTPVDHLEEQFQTINDNLQNTAASDRLMAATNVLNRNNDIARIVAFCPAFMQHAHLACSQIGDLLNGKLPIDSVIDVLTDAAEQALLNGRIGNVCAITARDLGIARLQMQAQGRRELATIPNLVQGVNPHQRQLSIQDMYSTPQARIGLALTQAQLIQNSLQNANNLAAAGDPSKFAELQVELQKATTRLGQEAQRGNLINSFVPDFSSVLAPQIRTISEGLLGSGVNTGQNTGGGQRSTGIQPYGTETQTSVAPGTERFPVDQNGK